MRENGFYWVIAIDGNGKSDDDWSIAEYDDGNWYQCGSEVPFTDKDMLSIGEKVTHA